MFNKIFTLAFTFSLAAQLFITGRFIGRKQSEERIAVLERDVRDYKSAYENALDRMESMPKKNGYSAGFQACQEQF